MAQNLKHRLDAAWNQGNRRYEIEPETRWCSEDGHAWFDTYGEPAGSDARFQSRAITLIGGPRDGTVVTSRDKEFRLEG